MRFYSFRRSGIDRKATEQRASRVPAARNVKARRRHEAPARGAGTSQPEALEPRKMMAFDLVQAFATSDTPFFLAGTNYTAATLTEAPQQIALRFSAGVKVDPTTIANAITVTRSNGLGDAFANGNDFVVTPGYIGVDDAPNDNQVIIRFAETLPNDSYRITIGASLKTLAEGSSPVQMFRDGGSFNLNFRLDLGAQVTSVVPQPVIRAKTIQFAALPQDGDLLEVAIRGGKRVFEFDGNGSVQSGNTAISISGKTTADLATDVAAAINALSTVTGFTGELGSASAASTTVTVSGVNFTPVVRFTRGSTVPATSPVTVSDGTALTQLKSKVVVYFNAADPLDASTVVPAAFKLFTLDSTTGADTATIASPTSVSYDAASASAVLTFAADLPADKLYRLQIGQSSVTPKADVTEGSNANSTFTAAKDLGSLSGTALERISVKVTGAINQTTDIVTPAGNLSYPRPTGDGTEPGHRDMPVRGENHLDSAPATPGQITVLAYNFSDYYGSDVQGNQLTNVITETQKQRAREIFDIYSRYTGIRFVETADQGITVMTGDLRAFKKTILRESVAGLGSPFSFAIMDSADNWGESEYGGAWFEVAMHEIGHALDLDHSYDIPSIMGEHYNARLNLAAEPVYPGNYDRVHLDQLFPRAGTDIDLYKFDVAFAGQLTAQTFVSRPGQPVTSTLDSVLTLYREDVVNAGTPNERKIRTLVARNDDYFGRDSFIGLDLDIGTYYIAVTSTGNTNFNPEIPDSGYGGRTDGAYELRVDFSPAASVTSPIKDATATFLDGDRDGKAGGEYKFWFQTAANTLFVDKAAYANFAAATTAGADGTLAKPFYRIEDAISAATAGSIIRIVGNTGNAASATDDRAYLIGTDPYGRVLEDGETFVVPKNVTVMIDAGATLKLRAANIDVGSSSSLVDRSGAVLQVLGTPSEKVFLTSFHDDARGGDSDRFGPAVEGGQWGGLVFRGDSDFKKDRVLGTLGGAQNNDIVFLNSVSNASLRYGGGPVVVDSFQRNFAPIHLESTRPSLVFNEVTDSAGAPISADPNSFEDTAGRVGPEIRGNRLIDNSINGIFVRIRTELGKSIDKLSVPARFRNTDAPYVITENLLIDGGAGGYVGVEDGDGNPNTVDAYTRDSGRLQVDPGVVIKLWRSRIELDRGRAQFIAEGMPNNRVIFTTLADNRFGGGGSFDTNGANLDVRTAGDWGGIIVNAGAKASIDQAYIAFGGGQTPIEGRFDNFSVVETHQGDLRLTNSRIENNAASVASSDRDGRGRNDASTIFVRGAQPIIVANDFRGNAGAMISVNANSLVEAENPDPGRMTGPIDRFTAYDDNRGPLVRANTTSYSGSGSVAGMKVRGEEITIESVWDDTDIVHVLQNEIIVQNFHTFTGVRLQSSPNASLVVKLLGDNAGFTAAGYGLDIDDRIGGTVQVVGFPTKPVILTSLKDDSVGASYDPLGRLVTDTNADGIASTAAPGDWRSLKFMPLSNDRNVAVVTEAEASYRGSSTTDPNGRIATAQVLGVLAPNFATGTNSWESAQEKSGDENRRLGFEVHGAIALDNPGDNDVYSFQGYSGSEVWFDIDKTSSGLDAMLELLDAAGNVIARSADAQTDGLLTAGVAGSSLPMQKDVWRGGDYYGTNPRDPGMRVILPTRAGYPLGSLTQYYVRVRSQAAYTPTTTKTAYESGLTATTPAALAAGASKGEYELRIRLRQRDEKPGSTVRSADIRFPTTGIDVLGLPHNSQVLGETAESKVDANNVWTSAQKVGNVLASNRSTISVAGELSSAADIDWYQFDLDIQQIQSVPGVNAGEKTWSMVFDIDYADGFRGDLTISVFDSSGTLIYVGRDSDVAADQPAAGQGNDFDDLSRGSVGKLDPFIGPIQMPATAGRYYVAVSSNEQLPSALNATFRSSATNSLIRLEPVNSVARVVEDHIGSIGYLDSAGNQIDPTKTDPLIDITSAITLNAHVTPFTLADVTLFLTTTSSLITVDAMIGGKETSIVDSYGATQTIGDLVMRSDGRLYSYSGLPNVENTVGRLDLVDTAFGGRTPVGNDNIPQIAGGITDITNIPAREPGATAVTTYAISPPGTSVRASSVSGTVQYTAAVAGVAATGTWQFSANALGQLTFTAVSAPAGLAAPTGGSVNGPTGVLTITWSASVAPADAPLLVVSRELTNAQAVTSDNVDAVAWERTGPGDYRNLFYSVRDGGRSRLYRANPANGSAAVVTGQPWGRVNAANEAYIQDAGNKLGIVTGMAFVDGSLYGVDTNGHLFEINIGTAQATIIDLNQADPGEDRLLDDGDAAVKFAGLSIGPQNLYNGALKNALFAIAENGFLYAFDTAGNRLSVFGDNPDTATGANDADFIDTKATGVTGIAFSPLDINLWHPTVRRGDVAGDSVASPDPGSGINRAPDRSREPPAGGAPGGTSMYFGLETYSEAPPYTVFDDQVGQYGVTAAGWQRDLTVGTGRGDTYDLPGGAYGSLTTSSFSLAGYAYTSKPTLYFNYWLQTQDASGVNDAMRDSARVFISKDNGNNWELVATNNQVRDALVSKSELPEVPSVSSAISKDPRQYIQELFDTSGWRQARIDLGDYAGEANLRLRFDFSTAGEFDPNRTDPTGAISAPAGTAGNFNSAERGQKNNYEGFYIDDIIVGFAERGEMVTGAVAGQAGFFDIATPEPSDRFPAQYLMGPYQLEMRRGIEYGANVKPTESPIDIFNTYDTDDQLTRANGLLGDENLPREQGQFIIEGNWIANAKTYGISIDAEVEGRAAFADDFTGSLLDSTKWVANADWGPSSNTVFTAAVNNNALTISGKSSDPSTTWKEDGNVRSAVRFDATQKITVESSISLEGTGTGRWAYMFLRDSGTNWIGFGKHVDDSTPLGTYLSFSNGTTTVLTKPLSTTVGSVYRMEYEASQVRFFVDGVLVGTQAFTLTNPELWFSAAARTKDDEVVAKFDDVRTNQLAAAADSDVPLGNAPRKLPTLNNSRLAPGAVVVNNVISSSGDAGIRFSGDPNVGTGPLAAVPYGRIVNNTIYGGATQTGVGIQVTENAAPTLLNNVFSGVVTAIDVDSTSVNDGLGNLRTVIGTSAFHNVGTPVKGTTASQSLTLSGNPFVAAQFANFYLAEGSQAIDSALNSLQDRTEYTVVTSPLGISVSPIMAPDRDIYGQLRGDDPKQASTPGLGSDIFKDRGAVDRVDFASPFRTLIIPADTVRTTAVVRDDLENTLTASGAAGRGITRLTLQLTDRGVGIDPATVRSEAFTLLSGTTPLVLGRDYLYSFDPTKNAVTLESVTVFAPDNYTLTANSQKAAGAQAGLLTDLANNTLRPNNDDGTLNFAITLQDVPDAPAGLAAVFGNASVSLSWTASAANGSPVDNYVIEYSTTGSGGWTQFVRPTSTATSATVTGLTNGQGYWFRVAAHNALGQGPWADAIGPVTPLKVLTLALDTDSGSSNSDGITSNGQVNVGDVDTGATWQYRTNGGAWLDGASTFFTLGSGSYAIGSIEVRQSVGGSVTGAGFNTTAITVDSLAPTITGFSSTTANGAYKAGDTINITATSSEDVQDGATITVTLDTGATVTLTRSAAATLTGSYIVGTGQNSSDLTVNSFTAGTVLDVAGNQLTSTTVPTGTNNIAGSKDIVVDTAAPTIVAFTSTTANGTYKAGDTINITATTSEAVQAGATITVTLDTEATVTLTRATATTLTGIYTVAAGQNTADLTVTSFTAGTVLDIVGNQLTSTAVPTGTDNIAGAKDIVVDALGPTITAFSSTTANGTYRAGNTIDITATTSEDVQAGATITVTLNTGATVTLTRANATTLSGTYTVAAGHNTTDLTVTSFTAGTVLDLLGNPLTILTVPTGANNIAGAKDIVVDTVAPTITAFSSSTANGSYRAGNTINITATTSEDVQAGATITVTLNTGATVTLTRATATTLSGLYTVSAGHNTPDLTVTSFSAGTVLDTAGNPLTSTTVPAGTNNIAGSKDIVVDTAAPTIVAFTSTTGNGTYKAGDTINITATTSETVQAGATITVTLNTGATVTLTAATQGTTLSGTYTVAAGHSTSDLTVNSFTPSTVLDVAGNPLTSTTVPTGSNNIGGAKDIVVDGVAPTITAFSSSTANGSYRAGNTINITAATSEDVQAGATITVTLNTGATVTLTRANATTLSGTYTVVAGHNASDLTVTSFTAGTVLDTAGNPLTSTTVPTGSNNIGGAKDIVVDTVAPTITAFSSSAANGTYKIGDTINITATTSEAVQSGATITVTLNTGATVTLTRATATTLSGTYTVAAGHNTSDLTVNSFTAGTVLDVAGNPLASTTVPTGSNNIGGAKDIVVDGVAPTITAFSSSTANGSYRAGNTINITATTSEDVQAGATITVTLNTGATVTLARANATTLSGTYTVAAGQNTTDLTVTSFTVGTVLDVAGNPLTSTTVPTGSNNIGGVKDIVVDTAAPTITAFSSSTANGTYRAGNTINITATTSEDVQAGATITVTLNTGATVTLTRATATTLSGTYTVAAGHNTTDLTVTSFTASTVLDIAGNPLTSTTVPAGSDNIGGAKDIVVDTVAPTITAFSSSTANGSYRAGNTINITATTSEDVQSGATITVTLNTGATVTLTRANATTLSGTYTVAAGHNTSDLTATSFAAGTVLDIAGNPLTSTTVPAGSNNIGGAKDIVVDTVSPTITAFSSITANGTYRAGNTINITATTSETVRAGATITVTLNTGATVTLTRTTATTLSGTYTVAAGHNTSDLTVTSFTAGTVLDTAGNPLTSTTVPTGSNNIGGAKDIVVDTAPPTITAFSSSAANGTYKIGDTINITATTSEAVQAGATITVTLNTGATVTLTRTTATTLSGTYTVVAGHNASDLTVNSFTAGTVLDAAGNQLTSTTVPTGFNNIGGAKGIAIDGAIRVITPDGFSSDPTRIPDRRVTVTSIPITFNTPVSGLKLANFRLLLNGRSVSLSGARLTGSGSNYSLTIPSRATSSRGIYTLQISATGIRASVNAIAMTSTQFIYWGKGRSVGL